MSGGDEHSRGGKGKEGWDEMGWDGPVIARHRRRADDGLDG